MSALLIALPLFYIGHFQMIQAIRGWPSDAALPEQFQLLGFRISEPDTRRGDDGRSCCGSRDLPIHARGYTGWRIRRHCTSPWRTRGNGSPQGSVRSAVASRKGLQAPPIQVVKVPASPFATSPNRRCRQNRETIEPSGPMQPAVKKTSRHLAGLQIHW
ncbi:MAG: hypothetical protein H6958_11905 [Chromatiaceae bacterium]|nr:hypothetical protein [Chromatiaceae bacterium]